MTRSRVKSIALHTLALAALGVLLSSIYSPSALKENLRPNSLRLFSSAGGAFDLSEIPDGYIPGRATAPYGAYSTPYHRNAREISDALNVLENKTYGLANYASGDEVKQATAVYFLEHQALGLLREVLNKAPEELTEFERESLKAKALRIYTDVRYHGERLYQTMIRRVDVALPGPNGAQLRIEKKLKDGKSQFLYLSNCRLEKCPTESERKAFYESKLKDFLANGGKVTDMFELNDKTLEAFGSLTRVEYVERPDGKIWVTKGDAGHALLAKGGPVQSAGQMVFIKNSQGSVEYLIVSNASGTYKPDLYSVQLLAEKLSQRYRIHPEKIVVTEGEPLGTQTVKVLLKASGAAKDKISSEVKAIESQAFGFIHNPKDLCQDILTRVAEKVAAPSRGN